MKRFSYRQRDDAFGQSMLALRTSLGLTQAELAERLGVSGRAVREWEAGSSYPKAPHLQHVITLAVRASAFPAGREAEEIRALWKAARQKVLLDEVWLASLLGRTRPTLTLLPPVPLEAPRPGELPAAQPKPAPQLDWGEALAVRAMQQLAGHFEVVLFRSLRDAPGCSALLESCLSVLAPESL